LLVGVLRQAQVQPKVFRVKLHIIAKEKAMKVLIELEGMSFHARHGCYELEKTVGNRFTVDVTLEAEVGDAAAADDLAGSVNYLSVYQTVGEQMAVASDILENVALRIVEAIRGRFPSVVRATAKVSKLAPPLGGKVEKVSVTVSK
jgi:dihydroneopterin aldolase